MAYHCSWEPSPVMAVRRILPTMTLRLAFPKITCVRHAEHGLGEGLTVTAEHGLCYSCRGYHR